MFFALADWLSILTEHRCSPIAAISLKMTFKRSHQPLILDPFPFTLNIGFRNCSSIVFSISECRANYLVYSEEVRQREGVNVIFRSMFVLLDNDYTVMTVANF